MSNERYDAPEVAIVGGGLAGLTAAVLLARGGRRVTLFEAGQLGGRATTQERNDFLFNFGPHAVYCGGALRRVLEGLGVKLRGSPPAGQGVALLGEQQHLLPRSAEALESTTLFGDEARLEAARVFSALPELEPESLRHTPVGEWLAGLRSPELRQLLAALIRLTTFSGDERQSMGSVAAQLRIGQAGVLYLDGGWISLVEQLQRLAREAGVRLHTGAPVARVEPAEPYHEVRLQDGTRHEAAAVVLALDPQSAARLLGPGTEADRWAETAIPVRMASLDLGLRRLPRPDARFALGLEQPHYFSVHAPSARLAPEGGATLHAARYLRADEEPSARLEQELEALVDRMQPGWREEVVERRFLRHATVTHSLVSANMGGTAGRPGPLVPGIANLYVAGDWVGPEGLLSDAAAASAELAAQMILSRPSRATPRSYALA